MRCETPVPGAPGPGLRGVRSPPLFSRSEIALRAGLEGEEKGGSIQMGLQRTASGVRAAQGLSLPICK